MRILVNGAPCEVSAATLAEALGELGYAGRRIATALDGDFVPASCREAHGLYPGCRIEIVSPMQGG